MTLSWTQLQSQSLLFKLLSECCWPQIQFNLKIALNIKHPLILKRPLNYYYSKDYIRWENTDIVRSWSPKKGFGNYCSCSRNWIKCHQIIHNTTIKWSECILPKSGAYSWYCPAWFTSICTQCTVNKRIAVCLRDYPNMAINATVHIFLHQDCYSVSNQFIRFEIIQA